MSASNPHQEQHQREQLADAIDRRRGDIERRWLERVRTALKVREVSSTELRNSMPSYLIRLTEGLRQSNSAEAGGTHSWEHVAREHAETRVRLGFNVDQLVQEFIILRQVLFEIIHEEPGVSFDTDQAARLADLIEGAIAAAVASYAQSRDYEARRQQAEHVGFITHELRNPLTTATLGMAHLRRSLKLTPEQARAFSIVERNHHRLAELIDGVLLVERDAHQLAPRLVLLTLAQVLDEPIAAAKLSAEAKGLHLEARFDPDLVVLVDPKLTRSAVENVIQNAVKYTDVGDVHVAVEDQATEVVVHIRDSCPGLSKEELRTIFEPFRRGHTHKPGAGLGLAIARRAVEAQGGTIHAEQGEDRGCHFSLTLPKPRH